MSPCTSCRRPRLILTSINDRCSSDRVLQSQQLVPSVNSMLRSFGDDVLAICNTEHLLSLELSDSPDSTLTTKLSEFVALVRALPEDARGVWDSATRRVFNIGIQSGLKPHCTEWTI